MTRYELTPEERRREAIEAYYRQTGGLALRDIAEKNKEQERALAQLEQAKQNALSRLEINKYPGVNMVPINIEARRGQAVIKHEPGWRIWSNERGDQSAEWCEVHLLANGSFLRTTSARYNDNSTVTSFETVDASSLVGRLDDEVVLAMTTSLDALGNNREPA